MLIHSVNKSMGQMARIDASVVETEFALTAITSAWGCHAFNVDPVSPSLEMFVVVVAVWVGGEWVCGWVGWGVM